MYRNFIVFFTLFFAATSLFAEEKKDECIKPKVKTGVEVEKGDNAPKWEEKILKKKKKSKKKIEKEKRKEKKLKKNKKKEGKKKKKG
ncbi:MAG: hypothetical protein ACOX2F_11640 [bacterium]